MVADGAAVVTVEGALARASAIARRYRGDGGAAYAAEVDGKYGGLRIIKLAPSHLVTWRADA